MHKTLKSHMEPSQRPLVREHGILSLHPVQYHLGAAGPHPELLTQQVLVGEPRNLQSPKFPVDALLLVQGPHFEKHCPHQAIEMCSHR